MTGLFGESHGKQFGVINIGNKIISYILLKLQLGVHFNVHMLPNWHITVVSVKLDMAAEPPCETCTHMVESCIRGHHVSKDF